MIPKRIVKQVIDRDGGICQINLPGCTFEATVADHRANRGMGGSKELNDPVCLLAACVTCNGAKETVTGDVLKLLIYRGVRVRRAATNRDTLIRCDATPVLYRHGDWYLLRSDGGRTYLREVNRALVQGGRQISSAPESS